MTADKIRAVVLMYREKLEKRGIRGCRMASHVLSPTNEEAMSHCYDMLAQIEGFLKEGRVEKAFRWLGFIQGVLWTLQVYTLDELKAHSSPELPPA